MIPATSWPRGLQAATWLLTLLVLLGLGLAIPVVGPRIAAAVEISLAISLVGFAAFYTAVRAELTLTQSAGAYFVALASLFVTMNGLRALPTSQLGLFPSATISDAFLLPGGILLAASWFTERYEWPTYTRHMALGAVLLAVSVTVTTAANASHGLIRPTGVFFWTSVVVTPLVVAAGARSSRALMLITFLWVLSAAINGAVAASDSAGLTQIGAQLTSTQVVGRASGLSDHVNHLGLSCAVVVPVGVALTISVRKLPLRIVTGVLTTAATAGVVESGSRSATLAALVGVATIPLLAQAKRILSIVLSLVGIIAVAFGYYLLAPAFPSVDRLVGQSAETYQSDQFRIGAWQAALDAISTNPVVGNGFDYVTTAHNLALQLLVSGGPIALVGFGLFTIGFLAFGWRCARDTRLGSAPRFLAAGVTASILVFLTNGAVNDQIYDRYLYWPFGLLLAIHFLARREGIGLHD